MEAANRNILWANVFVEELARQGLQAVCITPGSRSTPLVMAFSQAEEITRYTHLDERSAAYFALGLARATQSAVALICTSGTALANFYPAIVEANYSELPLLVLSADRPHELRASGSNQTIDQVKMFGDHVRWFMDVAPPEAQPTPVLLRYLRSLATRALATTQGVLPGPVHLNFPFRKPLEPTPIAGDLPAWLADDQSDGLNGPSQGQPSVRFSHGTAQASEEQIDDLLEVIQASPRGLIVCGPRCPRDDFPAQVSRLAQLTGYPLFADALSGVRFGPHVKIAKGLMLGGYESYLRSTYFDVLDAPQIVLQFGDTPTSKHLSEYLQRKPAQRRIVFSENERWKDDAYLTTDLFRVHPTNLCRSLSYALERVDHALPDPFWAQPFLSAERSSWKTLPEFLPKTGFEGGLLSDVIEALPPNGRLFVASSLPVRHLDQYTKPREKALDVFANRGVSGIDGTISSALGAAAASKRPLVLVTGDLAFFHDLNGLLALQRDDITATIMVINNDGGGIFQRLPISQFDPPFTELFLTPHGLSFEHAAGMFAVDYVLAPDRQSFLDALRASIDTASSCIIEVPSDSALYEKHRQAFLTAVEQRFVGSVENAAPNTK